MRGNQTDIPLIMALGDIHIAAKAIEMCDDATIGLQKRYKAQAAYHLQQAAEKLIKAQIYQLVSVPVNDHRMYTHNLANLVSYAGTVGVALHLPEYVRKHLHEITSWEAESRYDLHFSVRIDTLKRCQEELQQWYSELKRHRFR